MNKNVKNGVKVNHNKYKNGIVNDDFTAAYSGLCDNLLVSFPTLRPAAPPAEPAATAPPRDGSGDAQKEPTIITMESSVPGHGAIDLDAVFYRTDPFLYHKFGNMLIFRSANLYLLCSPGNQDYPFLILSSKKVEIDNGKVVCWLELVVIIESNFLMNELWSPISTFFCEKN